MGAHTDNEHTDQAVKLTAWTNDMRAALAEDCLDLVIDRIGSIDASESVTDLLTNLMHFCDRSDFDFDVCLNSARYHFEAERKEG